jgi:hypothetical protein
METVDISAGGASCISPTPIPPMTRLEISLFLPSPDGRAARMIEPIVVRGCVVRCEPSSPQDPRGGFRIAVFFTGVSDEDRDLIQSCLACGVAEEARDR